MNCHLESSNPDAVFASSNNNWTNDKLGVEIIKPFETHTSSNGHPGLHIFDGDQLHLSIELYQYVLAHNIILFWFPTHSTHLLQPLDVGLFRPLKHYYGTTADQHMPDTWSGIVKGTFCGFYSAACTATYTVNNIKGAIHKIDIFPFMSDSVIPRLPSYSVHSPVKYQTILHLNTPYSRWDLWQQTQLPINQIKEILSGYPPSAIATLHHFVPTVVTAWNAALINVVEVEDSKKRYRGNAPVKTDWRVITKAHVLTAEKVVKLHNTQLAM